MCKLLCICVATSLDLKIYRKENNYMHLNTDNTGNLKSTYLNYLSFFNLQRILTQSH